MHYVPPANFNGSDALTYRVCGTAAHSRPRWVTITVTPVADAPVATNDAATTPQGVAVVINVVANDTDADGDLVAKSVKVSTNPAHGTAKLSGTTGSISYTPASGFSGVDSFRYKVCDHEVGVRDGDRHGHRHTGREASAAEDQLGDRA